MLEEEWQKYNKTTKTRLKEEEEEGRRVRRGGGGVRRDQT